MAEDCTKKWATARANFRNSNKQGFHKGLAPQKPKFKPQHPPRNNNNASHPPRVNVTPCATCGKPHGNRPCLMGTNACFRCGEPGHMARECPQAPSQNLPRQQRQGR
ncbi:hypothetical protein PIB30_110114, partial [Stylosanthes scabra]|nr:hypothetical protein [Stylosanthes scabra]